MIRERNGYIWRGQLPPEAVGIQLFRPLKNGDGRCYWPIEFVHGTRGVEAFLTQQMVRSTEDASSAYGMIDLVDKGGDIVEEIAIPDAHQFQRLRRKLKCPVVRYDGVDRATPPSDRGEVQ